MGSSQGTERGSNNDTLSGQINTWEKMLPCGQKVYIEPGDLAQSTSRGTKCGRGCQPTGAKVTASGFGSFRSCSFFFSFSSPSCDKDALLFLRQYLRRVYPLSEDAWKYFMYSQSAADVHIFACLVVIV